MKTAITLLVFFLSLNLFSQNSELVIKVKDANSGETLAGANIVVEGVGSFTTDLDGNLTLEGLKNGSYNLICEAFSYNGKIIKPVEVKSGEYNFLIIELQDLGSATETGDISSVPSTAKASK